MNCEQTQWREVWRVAKFIYMDELAQNLALWAAQYPEAVWNRLLLSESSSHHSKPKEPNPMINADTSVLLSAHGLTRVIKSGKILLHPADFTVHAGDKIGVEGASGSGKSVLLRTMALLDWPDGGELRWQGKAVAGAAAVEAYRTQVAYVRQQPVLVPGNVADNLNVPFALAAYRGQKQNRELIRHMLERIQRNEQFLETDGGNLSGGEAQLVCLMRVLQLNPQVLLHDEPTAALDPESVAAVEELVRVWQENRQNQGAYVWISHSPEQLQRIAAKVWHVAAGKLDAGVQDA